MENSDPKTFINRWKNSGAAERANYQLFLSELCDVLGVPRPDPTKPDDDKNAYVFERSVTFNHADGSTSTGRILDPACGSGNFLYVTLEHLKRLEGEVLNALDRLGHEQAALEMAGFTVDPHQLLGMEVNPRAAAIAELVLWIGYLQWHFRTRGRVTPPEPIIKNFHNIECRDAVLAWDRTEAVLNDQGKPVTRWDGRTMKKHPATGEDVPDETLRVPLLHYVNPRPAEWPQADFIIGNPPYIGVRRLKLTIGDEYVDTLRKIYSDVPETSDYVMYW